MKSKDSHNPISILYMKKNRDQKLLDGICRSQISASYESHWVGLSPLLTNKKTLHSIILSVT